MPTLEHLVGMSMVPRDADRVAEAFIQHLQRSSSISTTFFAGAPAIPKIALTPPIDNLALAMIAAGIGRLTENFKVDKDKADQVWTALLNANGPQWGRQIYDGVFARECVDGEQVPFQTYLDNKATWGPQYAQLMKSKEFILIRLGTLERANGADIITELFYKLSRLTDDRTATEVVTAWKAVIDGSRLNVPTGTLEAWKTRNYLHPKRFNGEQFLGEVRRVYDIPTEHTTIISGQGGAGGSRGHMSTETVYGKHVGAFVAQSGLDKLDVMMSSCFLAGAPVLLADGSTCPIDRIGEGDFVLGRHGLLAQRTDEVVVTVAEREALVYGFNDYAPFFTAGHPFLTTRGWAAIDPDIAREENPSLEVTTLRAGDELLRVVSIEPFTYEEVRIEQFSARVIEAGTRVYGLHLAGARSYHVHGFCVAMNYPTLTAGRLASGFRRLTAEERAIAAHHLRELMPYLSRALGSFVEPALRGCIEIGEEESR